MKLRPLLCAALGTLLSLSLPAAAQTRPTPLAVAAAGDLRGVLEEVKGRFEAKRPDIRLELSFGSSGSFTSQIQQGAPFDVFLSADTGFPEQLQKAGLTTAEAPFPYARGSLALWIRKDLNLDPAKEGLKVLLHPSVKAISTANPQLAPYGRAGEAALRWAGLLEAVKPRLVFADNIAQAAQFLQAGSAEAGLISATQARHPALVATGLVWKVPAEAYPALRQAGVILKRTQGLEQARAFRDFLLAPEAQAILVQHGLGRP